MVNAMAQTMVTALGAGRPAGAHLKATVALLPMGAAQVLGATAAQVLGTMATVTVTAASAQAHLEEASSPERQTWNEISVCGAVLVDAML